tara:strand:- start:598 stop:1839 length:1242 start_codon:yes stop_codon:yes gene_type:complete
MISYNKALKILNKSKVKIKNENVLLKNSLHRISSENIFSKYNYPGSNNTALDGFAIRSKETIKANKNNKIELKILKTFAAGDNPKIKKLEKYSCIEVMTGTVIKKPFDTIIPYEQSTIIKKNKKKYISINKRIKKFNHIRFQGSDFKKGQIILKKGDLIKSSDILILKTLGISKINVKKLVKLVFFPTGNEITNKKLISPWQVRNSNGSYIKTFSKILPIDVKEKKILKDKDEKKFDQELKKCIKNKIDLVITIGGVSAGKYDFVTNIIEKYKGKFHFKNSKIRPGKPILFSKLNFKTAFFGLPGNPVSTAACFRFFVLPYVFKSLKYKNTKPLRAKLLNKFSKKKSFTRFVKGILRISKRGSLEFKILKGQESYKIRPLANSNAWGQLKDGKSTFKKGDIIDCHTTFGVNFL